MAIPEYFEAGMWFRAIGPVPIRPPYHLNRVASGGAGWPDNGTVYLLTAFQDSLAVSSQYGDRFGVVSVDLSEFSVLYQWPISVPFIGYRPDGSTVTTTFVTDGIIDGTGPLRDFQTFYFDSRFSDVVRVEVPTYGWALDNMVFSNVPEPGAFTIGLLGACVVMVRGLNGRSHRRRASSGSR
jgi:hypothetical protein